MECDGTKVVQLALGTQGVFLGGVTRRKGGIATSVGKAGHIGEADTWPPHISA